MVRATGAPAAPSATSADRPLRRHRTGAYWVVTTVVVGECAIGGAMDLLRMAPFYPVMIELGYPGYLATIMGTAKLIAAGVTRYVSTSRGRIACVAKRSTSVRNAVKPITNVRSRARTGAYGSTICGMVSGWSVSTEWLSG